MSPGKLVELHPGGCDEATLYVKGFLGRGEEPDHFESWLACHEALIATHGWGERALGYHWPAGHLLSRPLLALGSFKVGLDVLRIVRNVRRTARLGYWGALVAEELALVSGHFVYQYFAASRSARERATDQATQLRELAQQHARLRVVAHSLGCRHVIEAVEQLDRAERPHEIHLCAPACREEDVAGKLSGLARGHTFLYYTDKDRVLDLVFPLLARGRALGFSGPQGTYAGLTALDVSDRFDFWVHGQYRHRFHELVPAKRTVESRAQARSSGT